MNINRRPSSTLKLGKNSYEVYKDTELFNELKSLDKNYSKINASLGEVKVLGTDNFESMFKQSIISLNYTPLSTCFSKVLVYLVFKISVKTIRILNSIKIKSLR